MPGRTAGRLLRRVRGEFREAWARGHGARTQAWMLRPTGAGGGGGGGVTPAVRVALRQGPADLGGAVLVRGLLFQAALCQDPCGCSPLVSALAGTTRRCRSANRTHMRTHMRTRMRTRTRTHTHTHTHTRTHTHTHTDALMHVCQRVVFLACHDGPIGGIQAGRAGWRAQNGTREAWPVVWARAAPRPLCV